MGIVAGKRAVVTGAGGGIGRGHALLLAQEGARVVVNDIDATAAEAVVAEIVAQGGEALAAAADIASRAGAQSIIDACILAWGGIDIMVNNAGNLRDRSFLKMTEEEFDAVWGVHVKGTFHCAQLAALAMREQGNGGAIINTSSGSHFGNFGQTNYAAAKGAIASMTYTWALELARLGIRVNAICPVAMTRMTDGLMSDAQDGTSAAELWQAERNAPLVVYLASDEAANVSGQVFGVGGERLSHMIQPHYGKTLTMPGGWTVQAVREQFQAEMPSQFGVFGILGKPYPFHKGVVAPDAKQ
ncbi:SDR family oxidoreductase [Halieaceae bacterium IMCC14734]|uniref:SDR family oxidoreductase n=1 Tax=Candidatus Litorirhabdus singularis TaxID=2518993 RepID=A0ABT3TJR7_9GAMM|nr:SDR family NAD(P)-dependent oxidoreductase [Candidatus Litorirhabdus singularis]MCX2982556.1 SDR family oxidoreductase [Candidatus Litorirhabdus singularis]